MLSHTARQLNHRHWSRPSHILPQNYLIATRSFRYTPPCPDFHFDTHHFVQRLEREGLNRAQAEGIMSAMAEVIDESIRNMTSNMVTKADQEKVSAVTPYTWHCGFDSSAKHHYTQQVDFAQIKSELQLMEKNDLAMIKAENDRLVTDIEKLKQRLREEITRTQAGVRLDLNLEKGRMREESSGQELKIKEVDTRIEQEIAGLRTAIQASKVRRNFARSWLALLNKIPGYDITVHCWFRYDTLCTSLFVVAHSVSVTGCSALLMAYLRFRVWLAVSAVHRGQRICSSSSL